MCAYYDLGGEGVAYHDTDPVNHGSGQLNPVDGSYLHSFRINEGVDTSYTKFREDIDNTTYNFVMPEKDMLYIGWTEPGEWLKYTVSIASAGLYNVEFMYTSNAGGKIGLDIDGIETALCDIKSTFVAEDPVAWRQWHHWNKLAIAEVSLPAGLHVLTLRVVEKGSMNLGYLEFSKK
jgi:hypothetical protein